MESKHAVALVGFCLSMPVWAAEYEVEVRVTVERGCQLIGSTRNAGIESLGVLDFGRISRLDSGSGPLNAALLNQRVPRLECNPDTTYQLQLDGGQHGGTGDVRYLANGPRALPIPYRIYRDAARLVPLPVNVPVAGTVPSSGSVALPLYARIEPLKQVFAAGHYSDVLKVTLTW